MRFLIVPNRLKKEALNYADILTQKLQSAGRQCLEYEDLGARACDDENRRKIADCDMVIIIGGDGTVLRTARLLADFDLPVWCVNFGHVGHLADCMPDENIDKRIGRIICGDYTLEQRSTISCEIEGEKDNLFAFNEAVIHRSAVSRALRIALSVDGGYIGTFNADGVIVATATGSTAYNLSAGGPVLSADSTDLAITSICAVPGSFKGRVLPGSSNISFTVSLPSLEGDDKDDTPLLVLDGLKKYRISQGDVINVTAGEKKLQLVRTNVT